MRDYSLSHTLRYDSSLEEEALRGVGRFVNRPYIQSKCKAKSLLAVRASRAFFCPEVYEARASIGFVKSSVQRDG